MIIDNKRPTMDWYVRAEPTRDWTIRALSRGVTARYLASVTSSLLYMLLQLDVASARMRRKVV